MTANVGRPELRGLCLTCNEADRCMYLARAESPVWRCEEFDGSSPVGTNPLAIMERESASSVARSVLADLRPKPRGLCCNCDNLPTCCLPKVESGVWHCEEYV